MLIELLFKIGNCLEKLYRCIRKCKAIITENILNHISFLVAFGVFVGKSYLVRKVRRYVLFKREDNLCVLFD